MTGPSKAASASWSDQRVVGERAGVDDDRRAAAAGAVDGVDELALVVRLQVLELRGRGRRRPCSAAATWSASVAVP